MALVSCVFVRAIILCVCGVLRAMFSGFLAVSFQIPVVGVALIYLIMAASCALFAAMCLETYGLRVRELQASAFEEKMNLRGR